MQRFSSIFSQLLQLFPRLEFEKAVRDHKAEYQARGFSCWGQFVAMLFCPLGRAHTLREICGGLASCEGKLKHLGVPDAPKKSTLAYANEHRPWGLYQAVFGQLPAKCQLFPANHGQKKKFRFKNRLISLDSSVIDLSLSLFDWAKFRRTKGAIKLHLLLDHDGYLPSFAVITDAKTSDIKSPARCVSTLAACSSWIGDTSITDGSFSSRNRRSILLPGLKTEPRSMWLKNGPFQRREIS